MLVEGGAQEELEGFRPFPGRVEALRREPTFAVRYIDEAVKDVDGVGHVRKEEGQEKGANGKEFHLVWKF